MNIVNMETGEIIEGVKKIITHKQDEFLNENRRMTKENKEFVDEFGYFVFKEDSKHVNKLENKISNSDIARLIYVATYLDYDNILHFDDGKPINKKDLFGLVGSNKKIFYAWYNLMIKTKIIIEKEDGKLSMNKRYCIKGKLNKNRDYSRVFINAVRTIYKENKGKNMATLGNIIKLVPFINYKHNVLCWNPNEDDKEKIRPISVGEIVNELGEYKGSEKKFINQMSKFRIYDGQPTMLFFNDNEFASENYIIFNPRLVYSGKNEDLPEIYSLFVMLANKQKSKIKGQNQLNTSDTNDLSARKKGNLISEKR